jgi:hypothetical protein
LPGRFDLCEIIPATPEERKKVEQIRMRLIHRDGVFRDFRFAVEESDNGVVVWEKENAR